MSGKIKAKDLSYDKALPPFLQRLHDQNAGRGDTDRHERQIARPTRAKDPNEDDGPTVVDESGDTVSKEEYERLTKIAADDVPGGDVGGSVTGDIDGNAAPKASGALPDGDEAVPKRADQKLTTGLASKKRKAVKVVGDEEASEAPAQTETDEKKTAKKPKKKVKPVKLAFDEADAT